MPRTPELQQILALLRALLECIHRYAIADRLAAEVEQRRNAKRHRPRSDRELLRWMCHLIAYSQAAKAATVTQLLPVIDEMLGDYDLRAVAALDPAMLRAAYWPRLGGLRYPTKIDSMLGCARALQRVNQRFGTFDALLASHRLPLTLRTEDDIAQFWRSLQAVQDDLHKADMPFFSGLTTLCHLLKDFGYPCLKPDSGVMKAAVDLGVVEERHTYSDAQRRNVVAVFQRCSAAMNVSMAELDLYLLIAGGMSWARQFVTMEFYQPGACGEGAGMLVADPQASPQKSSAIQDSPAPAAAGNPAPPGRSERMVKPVSIRGHEEGRSLKVKCSEGQVVQGLIVAHDSASWTVIPYEPSGLLPFCVERGCQEGKLFFPKDSEIVEAVGRVPAVILGEELADHVASTVSAKGSAKSKWDAIALGFFGDAYDHHFVPLLMSGPELIRIEGRDDRGYVLRPAGLTVPSELD